MEYEDILKKRIKKKEEKKDIQDYCYFLYQENRFEDLLKILKKYKSKTEYPFSSFTYLTFITSPVNFITSPAYKFRKLVLVS